MITVQIFKSMHSVPRVEIRALVCRLFLNSIKYSSNSYFFNSWKQKILRQTFQKLETASFTLVFTLSLLRLYQLSFSFNDFVVFGQNKMLEKRPLWKQFMEV